MSEYPITVDRHRLFCPLPVIRIQETVEVLTDGDQAPSACTDRGEVDHIPAWRRNNSHEVSTTTTRDEQCQVKLCKGRLR